MFGKVKFITVRLVPLSGSTPISGLQLELKAGCIL